MTRSDEKILMLLRAAEESLKLEADTIKALEQMDALTEEARGHPQFGRVRAVVAKGLEVSNRLTSVWRIAT